MSDYGFLAMERRLKQLENGAYKIREQSRAAAFKCVQQCEEVEKAYKEFIKETAVKSERELEDVHEYFEKEKKKNADFIARNIVRIENAYKRASNHIRQHLESQIEESQTGLEQQKEKAAAEYNQNTIPLTEKYQDVEKKLHELSARTDELKEDIQSYAAEYFVEDNVTNTQKEPPEKTQNLSFSELTAEVDQALDMAYERFESMVDGLWFGCTRFVNRLISYGIIGGMLVAGFFLLRYLHWNMDYLLYAAGIMAAVFFLSFLIFRSVKKNVAADVEELSEYLADIYCMIEQKRHAAKVHMENQQKKQMDVKMDKMLSADETHNKRISRMREKSEQELNALKDKYERIKTILREKEKDRNTRIEKEFSDAQENYEKMNKGTIRARYQEVKARKQSLENDKNAEINRLKSDWNTRVAEYKAFVQKATAAAEKKHPAWNCDKWEELTPRTEFPEIVYTGTVPLNDSMFDLKTRQDDNFTLPDLTEFSLPVMMSYPECGSMMLRTGTQTRGTALEILFNTALRILTSFPPAKARFTILDPVGLGQNFSALMHLADYDESLVGGRIWTETAHIEKRLGEITGHIEKVIQKYLRNRYESIDEYNREAGDMAEAYQFIIIADFPNGFSELAVERLMSILNSGVKCGVYTLIHLDEKQPLPEMFREKTLLEQALVIREKSGQLAVDAECLGRNPFEPESLPEARLVTPLLQKIGMMSSASKRVELPFDAVLPDKSRFWQASAEDGIRVPIGKAGADRLQYLDLGHGTAQHALISGKTGSGKSTLFHVVISSVSIWFSPSEVQMYLIDFKKGVEFKTYARNRTPHARVIAIESDREFGLSALRSIDNEFTRRGELFRNEGVQSLSAFRKKQPHTPMPRILLIIDEFQEFFTEDDGVAQDAALLLDRIVRQGRAFGVHVVLGSQTLGGAYTLAKSTLGQMAVRIALQCNEADSYLILSDDNSAARLLSRPGEAIYNDMSGLVEGNNPFQVVWLSDEIRDRELENVRKQAENSEHELPPAVVFEGNVPADIRKNPELNKMLETPGVPESPEKRIWLGEPNAIKGPAQITFHAQSGNNLLIIGQRSDVSMGIIFSSILSLSASYRPGTIQFTVLDGSTPDTGHTAQLEALSMALPHKVDIIAYRDIPEAVLEFDRALDNRQNEEGASECSPIFLIVFGLQRLRMLRESDEFDFSTDQSDQKTPEKAFVNILRDGPQNNMHSIIWCDSLNNLNRSLSRKTIKEFELNVLFQMSATDSAELIDSPAASRLGLYTALLFAERGGIMEKFRPYALPGNDTLENIKTLFTDKYS